MPELDVASSTAAQALSLWTGDGNAAPPANWQTLAFDDSGWPAARVPEENPGYPDITGAAGLWSSDLPQAVGEDCLLRQHFTIPAGTISGAGLQIEADDYLLEVYVNGRALGVNTAADQPAQTLSIDPSWLRAGYDNVLAVRARNGPPGDGIGAGFAAVAYLLSVQYAVGTGSPGGAGNQGFSAGALADTVRVRHRTGPVCWEHDGTIFRVSAAGHGVLQTPFPVMACQPAALLGQDPVTGLPMWTGGDAPPPPPPPPPVSRTYPQRDHSLEGTHGAPDPLPVPPSAERVCGAAEAMTVLSCLIYDAIVQVINKAKSDILTDFTQGLKAELSAELVSLLTEAEFAGWAIDAVQLGLTILAQIVQTLVNWGTSLPLIWPPNTAGHTTSQQYGFIWCAAWQALWLTGGDYFSQSKSADGLGTKDYWTQYLAPQWSFFAGSTQSGISQTNPPWQLVWINAIIARVSDGGWAFAASKGAEQPSTGCTGCTGYPP